MKTIAITIEDRMLDRLDAVATGEGKVTLNRSRFIREAILEHLDRIEKHAEEERERKILRRHREKLKRQAAALLHEQAKP